MLLLEHKYSVCAASVAVFILFKCEYKKSYWVRSVTSVWRLHLCRTPLVFIGSVFVCPCDRRLPLHIPLRFVTASATTENHHSEEKAHNGSYCLRCCSLRRRDRWSRLPNVVVERSRSRGPVILAKVYRGFAYSLLADNSWDCPSK
jgi:hypothetical protein